MRPKIEDPSSQQVNVHFTAAEKRQLEEIARRERRPLAQLVRIVVQDYLRKNEAHGWAGQEHLAAGADGQAEGPV